MKSRVTCSTSSGCLRINGKSDRLPCEGEHSELPSPTEGVCQKCKVHCSCPGRPSASLDEEDVLALSAGEWCETTGRSSLTASVARKLQAFLQARPGVLHLDEIINKKDPMQVGRLVNELMKHQIPIQVAFLQGAIPLQTTAIFPRLLEFLLTCPVWSVNLGELRFSEEQCSKLAECLRKSGVTHMFYECTVAGGWKETYRGIIRDNRQKHARWRLGPVCSQNQLVLAAVKNWFAPTSHDVNKQWAQRNRSGWTNVERVQCEACRKWRRLPPELEGWPREFYCAENTWDAKYAKCSAPEEKWERELPTTGDIVMYQVALNQWLQGRVHNVPPQRAKPNLELTQTTVLGELDHHPLQREPRRRKPVERFEAASCTQYTRDLRKAALEDEERRVSLRMVLFSDGEERCVPFTRDNRWSDWIFAWQWEKRREALVKEQAQRYDGGRRATAAAHAAALAHQQAQHVAGQRVSFKVDGRAWREIELVAPCTTRQWHALKAHALNLGADAAAAASSGAAAGGGGKADDEALRSEWWQVRCFSKEEESEAGLALRKPQPHGAGGGAPGGDEGEAEGTAAAAEVVVAPSEVRMLLRLTAETQWEQWCPFAAPKNEAGGSSGTDEADDVAEAVDTAPVRGRGRGSAGRGRARGRGGRGGKAVSTRVIQAEGDARGERPPSATTARTVAAMTAATAKRSQDAMHAEDPSGQQIRVTLSHTNGGKKPKLHWKSSKTV